MLITDATLSFVQLKSINIRPYKRDSSFMIVVLPIPGQPEIPPQIPALRATIVPNIHLKTTTLIRNRKNVK